MARFDSFNSFERFMEKELKARTNQARDLVDKELFMNVNDYYTGEPKLYKRTGTLLIAPTTTPVMGGGKNLEFKSYMDEGISYNTGSFSGAEVIDATERGGAGTIGNHGYFQRTDESVDRILAEVFSDL